MENLDQIRAKAALAESKDLDRSAIAKLPALILSNGLLAAAAFCEADGGGENRVHQKNAMNAIARHLAERRIVAAETRELRALLAYLSGKDSITLQRATTEALAFLSFLKRFAAKGGKSVTPTE